jgi:hypothetical protein
MRYVVSAMLIVVGVIHLMPLSGALGSERLAALYGLSFDQPDLAILMRHRAILFGLLGAFLLLAAFRTELQTIALVAGFVSVASFLYFAWSTGNYNAQIGRVVAADVVALACLVIGALAHGYRLRAG